MADDADVCDSCGSTDGDIQPVHRLYVVPDAWDQQGSVTKVPEPERWCFSCRSLYPHETGG